jgi:D-alanine transaminase
MKQRASEAGANEAIIVDGDRVLEGASTSVFVIRDGVIATPPNSSSILPGTTRNAVLDLAQDKLPTQVRDIRRAELFSADEVRISAATRAVLPITRIDGKTIGGGRPGPLWQRMLGLFEADRARLRHTPAL